ncbi:MAG TPA: transcription termination/antitermination NusG family protein [Pirellulales bacterium]|nr:transcription termination/antitermination NusG family protein [Pirellulales bacterium]
MNREPHCFPSDLLTQGPLAGGDRRWWVLHTKARQEKSVARDLLAQQVPYFLPQVEKTLLVRGRKQRSYIPLFTSYVFLYGSELERYRTLTTNRIGQVIDVKDQSQFHGDLAQVWKLIEAGAPLTVESRLTPGDRVRVRSGSLAGVEGTVTVRRSRCRLLVAVRLLQQGVSIEIEDFLLEPI